MCFCTSAVIVSCLIEILACEHFCKSKKAVWVPLLCCSVYFQCLSMIIAGQAHIWCCTLTKLRLATGQWFLVSINVWFPGMDHMSTCFIHRRLRNVSVPSVMSPVGLQESFSSLDFGFVFTEILTATGSTKSRFWSRRSLSGSESKKATFTVSKTLWNQHLLAIKGTTARALRHWLHHSAVV